MTVKIDGTNTEANPAFTGADTDTGLQCGTNELKLVTGGSARATVDSSGRVLLGTTSPGDGAADNLTIADSGNCGITIRSGTSSVGGVYLGDSESGVAQYRGYVEYNHTNDYLRFGTASGERLRVLAGGGLTFNGDTAAANALDDYEEGEWTPSCTFGGGNTGLNLNVADGHYIKIGNFVYCNFILAFINKGTSTGQFRLTGLPFTAGDKLASTILESGGMFAYAANISGSIEPPYTIIPENNSTVAAVKCAVGNLLNANMTSSNFNNNTSIRGFFSYITS